MKVAIVNHNLGSGGAEKLIYDIALELKQNKVEFSIILLTSLGDVYGKNLLEQGIDVIYLSNKWDIYSLKNILRLKKILKNYDVVHTHTYAAQLWTAFASLFLSPKKKFITTEHSTNNRRRKIKMLRYLDNWMYSRYNTIVSINEVVEIKLKNWLKRKYNFKIIENGVNIKKIINTKGYQKSFLGYTDQDKLICMVARLIKMKSHETLIESLSNLPSNYKCIFLGEGEYREQLETLVKMYNLENRILFLGYRNDVIEIIKMCDLGILTSEYEGLPLSIIETMCLKPIIGSNVPGIKDLLEDSGILFEYKNSKELTQNISEILTNQDYYEFIKKRCLKKALRFDIKNTVEKYLKVYID